MSKENSSDQRLEDASVLLRGVTKGLWDVAVQVRRERDTANVEHEATLLKLGDEITARENAEHRLNGLCQRLEDIGRGITTLDEVLDELREY